MDCEVLIAGAGPTGLMLACWLTRLGVKAIVVDKKSGPVQETRALGVHARSLEIYDQLGIDAISEGVIGARMNLWLQRQHVGSAYLGEIGKGLSPHPYVFVLGQDANERLMLEHLRQHGGDVRWNTELRSARQSETGVEVRLQTRNGEQSLRCQYLCGCDGTHSGTRETAGIGFPGGTYRARFYLADAHVEGPLEEQQLHFCLAPRRFIAFFPLPGHRRFRLVGLLPEALEGREHLSFEDVRPFVEAQFRAKVSRINWFSTYNVHHRVAERFQRGRIFLLGDAAHVHSPIGAQGMNTGLQDATNLGWKLAAVLRQGADPRWLETYAAERRPFAMLLINFTDQAFKLVTARHLGAIFLRSAIMPLLFRVSFAIPALRLQLFRFLSQIHIHYPDSAISRGRAGRLRGGDRLPWNRSENFRPLQSLDWQVHVYGDGPPEHLDEVPVHRFPLTPSAEAAGFQEGAVYLVRPDGYLGLVQPQFDYAELRHYLASFKRLPELAMTAPA